MNRREFLEVLAIAGASGLALDSRQALAQRNAHALYELPTFGNVSLLHFTDCHAQLLPSYYREPNINIGVGKRAGAPPHLVGEHLLKRFRIKADTAEAHAFTHLDYVAAAKTYGKVGGFAHLATLVERLRAERPNSLLLDSGDTWQGSGVSLWTQGADMIEASKLLGVDVMTGHWEFTYGAKRVKQAIEKELTGKIEFLAQNVKTLDFGEPVFKPYTIRSLGGIPVAVIGQAFPYTPIANPRHFVADWTFGIQEEELQKLVNEVRAKGALVVALLSHNGSDIDLKLAGRVTGIDVIFGGHTHDAIPQPSLVENRGGRTLVTNSGSNGKFLAVLDLDVKRGRIAGYRYRLLPVFSKLLAPDAEMAELITGTRAPYQAKLSEKLAVSEGLLYRRGNFNGTFDQLICDAMMEVKSAEIAFSPGFRWGTSLLPGQTITMEHLLDQTATTYSYSTLSELTGNQIKVILEDICDNLFNPDPYKQQGGDMVRIGGLTYTCAPTAKMGNRVQDMRLGGKPIDPGKKYKVAGWAPVAEGASGEPIWEVVSRYLRAKKIVRPVKLNQPKIVGVERNPGLALP
ncbi:MAG: thiosulfohydrolase SoxB [Betaproteobacteria bacterium]|nr:thiosulfohydrolase SoxB [Betaproteobacteria bacterium]MDH3436130.1 thiosulfohydrolase SoxB [Betaproteobacteria bacterium]